MTETSQERILSGFAASDGLVVGRAVRLVSTAELQRLAGSPEEERSVLAGAITRATEELEALAETQDEMGAGILEFQTALLEDEDLLAPVYAAVEAGQPADQAWIRIIDGEVTEYREGEDDYFKARADDLLDLKERVLAALHGRETAQVKLDGDIIIARDLTPSRFLELDWSLYRGVAVCGGSPTSHVAILARARGVPLVVGLEDALETLQEACPAVLDAESGRLILAPESATLEAIGRRLRAREADDAAAESLLGEPAVTAQGERIEILINADDPKVLAEVPVANCDGIGLTRTEFLFSDGALPDEQKQFEVYRDLMTWAEGRPVIVRTLDAGGDKPIPGVTVDDESNPFLGLRGVRLSLLKPEVLKLQLRALARAAALGPLKIMIPMVTVPEEVEAVRALLEAALSELTAEGVAHARPQLGMMVEVPAAALTADRFKVDFFSIGSNDLIQYTTACARDNAAVTRLADARNPAVLELIGRTIEAAARMGVEVSLCGDMASDPHHIPALLERGLRRLSVAPAQVGRVKLAVRRYG
ncbi:phosphoenolpyruvate--protein phosphotransferase [Denitrobaculum tricleocarpae]|uniref:Phosphoenolpyruvate-protein phosphotransferase n=1 Tax=Denitrobaculum tricleocarpae TaxID=2591009 RepID=A0A545TES6_9PROT|nr:phosphoenolpyruvate--protein phosphotransferase [Denitrobaculum tricleocarpae]TQV75681.1 phosphoenolpyruvate--protein phosphotransferase [Denitrobaculum tricleocarpae]